MLKTVKEICPKLEESLKSPTSTSKYAVSEVENTTVSKRRGDFIAVHHLDNLATRVEDSGGWDNKKEPQWK